MANVIFKKLNSLTGLITFDRVTALNALNFEMLKELHALLEKIKGEVKILILTGAGEKAFIAGADIKEMNNLTPDEFSDFLTLGQEITKIVESDHWVSIAAVNGYALGGGAEIALCCDIVYASENAKFGLPEVHLGIIPGFGGTVRLGRKIPLSIAKEYIFKGEMISADMALKFGLANKVFSSDTLLGEAIKAAERIAANSMDAVLAAKRSLNYSNIRDFEECLKFEHSQCHACFEKADRTEGMTAFIEKRVPEFRN
jgi:enoyl-CoA hydratase